EPVYAGLAQPYGKYYQHTGFFGKWILAPFYCALLFEHPELMTAEQKAAWQSYTDLYLHNRPVLEYARIFDGDLARLHFGEFLPREALLSAEAEKHAENEAHM